MNLDNLFCLRFLVAWENSRSVPQVARRLGGNLTTGEVRQVARRLRREGVNLSRQPEGPGLLGHVFVFCIPDGDFQDLRGRDAYEVGTGTPIEGPWECGRCADRMVRGFCVLSQVGDRHWHVCQKCVRVVR